MYKEVNPAVFAMVTFPFLFGVMFGDVGHGSLMLIAGIIMCLFNGAIQKTALAGIGQIRYLILLMGIFALYNGFVYNEFFAIPLEIFGSCFDEEIVVLSNQKETNQTVILDKTKDAFGPKEYGF